MREEGCVLERESREEEVEEEVEETV